MSEETKEECRTKEEDLIEFKNYYINICKEKPKDACLFGLSTLLMRHISNRDLEYFNIIKGILANEVIDIKSPELDKLRFIIEKVEDYDSNLIEYLSIIELDIVNTIGKSRGQGQNKSPIEKQRNDIKEWWN